MVSHTNCNSIKRKYYTLFIYSTRWHSNPYINGAYSYISTNCDNNETISNNVLGQVLTTEDFYPAKRLKIHSDVSNGKTGTSNLPESTSQKSCKPIVLFAGEACHEKYFSTAHGAFLSGFEQAQRIVELHKQATN